MLEIIIFALVIIYHFSEMLKFIMSLVEKVKSPKLKFVMIIVIILCCYGFLFAHIHYHYETKRYKTPNFAGLNL